MKTISKLNRKEQKAMSFKVNSQMSFSKPLLLILICLAFVVLRSNSQDTIANTYKYWIDLETGFYGSNKSDGITYGASVNLMKNNTIFKFRYLNHHEFLELFLQPNENYHELGFLIGKGLSYKYFQVNFSGGIGFINGIKRGQYLGSGTSWIFFSPDYYQKVKFIVPSIPLEIDLLLKPVKFAGLGITLFGNLNGERPIYGFTFQISLGKLR